MLIICEVKVSDSVSLSVDLLYILERCCNIFDKEVRLEAWEYLMNEVSVGLDIVDAVLFDSKIQIYVKFECFKM